MSQLNAGRRRSRRAATLLSVPAIAGAVLLGLVATAPQSAGVPEPAPTRTPLEPQLPRLRSVTPPGEQFGHLEDYGAGATFVPRGVNYVRLAEAVTSEQSTYQSTFEPGRYDAPAVEAMLAALERDGYNAVRVFIDQGHSRHSDVLGAPHGIGRGKTHDEPYYGPYLDNVADFVERAEAHGVRVMFSLDLFPQNAYYSRIVGPVDPGAINIAGRNLVYLHEGYVRAKEAYLRNFVTGLKERVGAKGLAAVLAYETDNEAHVTGAAAPYSRMSGTVRTMNGLTYDMSDPTQRQQSADANFVVYANRMVAAVQSVDPYALVTMGTFTNGAVFKTGPKGMPTYCDGNCQTTIDYRYPARVRSLSAWSDLSFLDIHIYPADKKDVNSPYTLARNLETIEWNHVTGTVLIGEYGADKKRYNQDVRAAAYAMRDMQRETCARGFGGWLFWTFDTTETASQQTLFNLQHGGGAINGQLAPIVRPDPCR